MADWPDIATPSIINDSIIKVAHRSETEAGYIHTRSKWTVDKDCFALGWTAMSSTDKATLKTFFKTNQGSTFTWTNPETSATHTCMFADDKIEFKFVKGSSWRWAVAVTIIEQRGGEPAETGDYIHMVDGETTLDFVDGVTPIERT